MNGNIQAASLQIDLGDSPLAHRVSEDPSSAYTVVVTGMKRDAVLTNGGQPYKLSSPIPIESHRLQNVPVVDPNRRNAPVAPEARWATDKTSDVIIVPLFPYLLHEELGAAMFDLGIYLSNAIYSVDQLCRLVTVLSKPMPLEGEDSWIVYAGILIAKK